MDDFDFVYDREEEDNEDWFCSDCNMGPIDSEKSKCPRCGFKLKHHREDDLELDENGDAINMEEYYKHY